MEFDELTQSWRRGCPLMPLGIFVIFGYNSQKNGIDKELQSWRRVCPVPAKGRFCFLCV
ncbi:hypothetical protein HYU19_05860 [Candidatus Woesearchaeota archaeon]|nr:hypothetical protein [Candidatus Woesearchaeota archaeon]